MAVANLPFYSTSYGEGFGYNERDGTNTSTFRNRYLNSGYRGTADLGPARFNATRAQTTQNLGMTNTQRPQTSQPRQQTTQQQQSQYQYQEAPQQQQQAQATQQLRERPQSSSMYQARSPQAQQPQQQSQQFRRQGWEDQRAYDEPQYEETPRGVYTAPAQSQSQSFSRSSSRFAPSGGEPTVNDRPYYVAPFDVPPSHQFAPSATALGNRTYRFETDRPEYAFSQTFRGRPLESSRPLQDPGQSIPFGRLQAEDAKDVRLKMSLSSWDTFHAYDRNSGQSYNLSGLRSKIATKDDQENYCKGSISRRLESGAQLRYHIPSYCGYIPTAQFRHGSTYGKTTRQALAGSQVGL